MGELKALYELFILGRLMAQPFHGYLLRQMLGVAIGPTRQISWGVLYPLIRRLEAAGLIAPVQLAAELAVQKEQEAERLKRAFQITDAGRARFFELMREPGIYNADYADWFSVKLSCFAYIPRAEQLDILHHYRGYLHFARQHLLTARQHVATLPAIRDFERVHYLRMLDHKILLLDADLAWLAGEMARADA